ncbi:YfhO family protein [Coleofasciculus chthonoplastes]|uniref:YfhO family protein n=1 Tax=Coleofasciculus chthonoplastes TaxID=64178 RepID=UPI0033013866
MALVEAPLTFRSQNPDVAATAEIISLSNSQIEIQTDSTSPAFLVLSDVYYPGWNATIDGKPIPIFQTNYVLRGVQIPAGNHRVTFEFNPVSFHLGLGVSSASLVLLGYLAWKLSRNPNKITE